MSQGVLHDGIGSKNKQISPSSLSRDLIFKSRNYDMLRLLGRDDRVSAVFEWGGGNLLVIYALLLFSAPITRIITSIISRRVTYGLMKIKLDLQVGIALPVYNILISKLIGYMLC